MLFPEGNRWEIGVFLIPSALRPASSSHTGHRPHRRGWPDLAGGGNLFKNNLQANKPCVARMQPTDDALITDVSLSVPLPSSL